MEVGEDAADLEASLRQSGPAVGDERNGVVLSGAAAIGLAVETRRHASASLCRPAPTASPAPLWGCAGLTTPRRGAPALP